MKKILLTCFLGGVCLFQKANKPIRSWPNLIRAYLTFLIKNLFRSDEGGAYFTPRYEECISPKAYFAEGIPLFKTGRGNRNKHISTICLKFALKSGIVAFLLFFGFSTSSIGKVADSPPGVGLVSADSPYPGREEYSTPAHKGKYEGDGEEGKNVESSSSVNLCSKSLVPVLCLDLDGGPVTASGEFKSTDIPNSFVFDGLRKVESADSSQSSVLIYGELINPDSLGPLSFQVTPHYFSKKSRFMDFSLNVPLEEGTFFDGVLDPRVRKFSVEIEDLDNTGLFTLALGDREVLAEYFIRPGDSLKIGLDLLESSVVFGGPNAAFYEVQYLLNRARKEEELNEPRKLMLGSANSLLADSKNDSLWKAANESFGSKLSFQVYGKESLEQVLNALLPGSRHLQKQLKILDSFQNDLDPGSYDLLKLEVYARHYGPLVSTLYRFYYNELPRFLSSVEIQDYKAKIEAVLIEMGMEEFQMDSKLISPSYLDLQLDRLTLLALVKQDDFGDLVEENFQGPLQDRILAGFLSANSKRYPDPAKVFESLGSGISHSPWKERVESLKNAVALGLDMIRLEGVDPEGNIWNSKASSENPRLYYFYFSTCPHSAHYFEDYLYPFWKEEGSAMGLDLIAVSIDQDQNLWIENLPLFSSLEIPNYRLSAASKSQFSSFYEVSGYPFTLLVDSKGKVRSFKIPASNYLDFESKMTALLEAISVQEGNTITEVEADSDGRME